jgi:hypothetical protein
MRPQKISFMSYYHMRLLVVVFVLAGSCFVFPASHLAFAHTFSISESADFLSLVDQIRAETGLVNMNLENNNNNLTLAQAHAAKASSLLDNNTLGEIREKNNRIADSLESGLKQLEGNVTSLASTSQGQQQISEDRIQSINQAVMSLNDTLAEAVTVRVESEQQNNATTWAMALADLVNVVLSNYGNATGAPFDLTNMAGMEGMEMDRSGNMTMMNDDQMQMSGNRSSSNNTMTMTADAAATTTSSMSNMTATVVDESAYQSAQYLANNTTLRLFNDVLKPLTISADATSTSNNNNNASMMTQEEQGGSTTVNNNNNMTSNIDKLEAGLLQLRDNINGKATPNEVMITAHVNIHPLIMQIYGLTTEDQE